MPCLTVNVKSETVQMPEEKVNWLVVGGLIILAAGIVYYLRR